MGAINCEAVRQSGECERDVCEDQRSPRGDARWAGAGNLRRSLCSPLLPPSLLWLLESQREAAGVSQG